VYDKLLKPWQLFWITLYNFYWQFNHCLGCWLGHRVGRWLDSFEKRQKKIPEITSHCNFNHCLGCWVGHRVGRWLDSFEKRQKKIPEITNHRNFNHCMGCWVGHRVGRWLDSFEKSKITCPCWQLTSNPFFVWTVASSLYQQGYSAHCSAAGSF